MQIETQLAAIGLTKSEIRVYLFLLESGVSTPPQVSRGTKIARTNCYNILQALKEKKLIEEQKKGKRKAYLASDPEALLRSLERKKEAVERLLPDLRALYTVQKNKPKITFYDGLEQIKDIYDQSLNSEEIHAIGSTQYITGLMPEFFEGWTQKIKKKGIMFHDIITHESREKGGKQMKELLKGMYSMHTFPSRHDDFPTDILVWNKNIALITLAEPIFGTVLTSPILADTFRIMFTVMVEGVEGR